MKQHSIIRCKNAFKKYLLAGFLVLVPIGATLQILKWGLKFGNTLFVPVNGKVFYIIPADFIPLAIREGKVPGVGLIFLIIVLLVIGMITTNFFGRKIVKWWDSLIDRIPLVRKIYTTVKQLMDTIFSKDKEAFKKVVLIEYPRKSMYSIAFLSGKAAPEVNEKVSDKLVTVFLPTTPNPTSGFLLVLPEKDIIPLDFTVEEAFRFIVSGGIVTPNHPAVKNSE